MARRQWHEDRIAQGRHSGGFGGVDHGSAGIVLAELRRGNGVALRLVWFGGSKVANAGVRGFGFSYSPAHLEIIDGGGYWRRSLFREGRLSARRIAEAAAEIDGMMGDGTTAAIDIARTLVIVEDGETDA